MSPTYIMLVACGSKDNTFFMLHCFFQKNKDGTIDNGIGQRVMMMVVEMTVTPQRTGYWIMVMAILTVTSQRAGGRKRKGLGLPSPAASDTLSSSW